MNTTETLVPDYTQPAVNNVRPTTEGQSATFQAVYDSDPNSENAKFFASTPAITLQVAVARGRPFETGKSYYLDFTEVPAAAAASA